MAVDYDKNGKIALITINRPEAKNAIDLEVDKQLNEYWSDFRDDPGLWVAIITGTGDSFSSGADLKSLIPYYSKLTSTERRELSEKDQSFGGITRNFKTWKPMIAAVNGHCLAGGLEIALACDIRLASENATFGLMEVRWGIIPGAGGTQRLPRVIPVSLAMEMILAAKQIDAHEAYRIGLVNKIHPKHKLMDEAMKLAESICEKGPLAVRAAKEAMIRGLNLSLEEGLRIEASLSDYLRHTEDAKEGPRAFVEKRKPKFQAL